MSSARKARLFIGFLRFCSWLPLPLSHLLGAKLALLYFPFARRERHIVLTNLRLAYPQLSRLARYFLMIKFFINLGKTVTELGTLWLWERHRLLPLVKEVRGQENLDRALTEGRGVMLLCPHWGAWEMMGLYWSARYGITNLYQPPDYPEVAAFIKQARERMGANLVPTDMSGVRALLSALKQNQLIGILPDQDPGKQAESSRLFLPNLPIRLCSLVSYCNAVMRLFCSLCANVCLGGEGYRIHILTASNQLYAADETVSAVGLNQGVEACIALDPAQYVWNYKRWKRQADASRVY